MRGIFNKFAIFGLASLMLPSCVLLKSNKVPNDFVKLSDIVPNIIQSQRYSGSENFLARPVPGYHHRGIYCTRQMALALKKVDASLNKKGYALVVYDAYRPQRAVDAFIVWSKTKGDEAGKAKYYPSLPKNELFELGYLFGKSGHSRGSTIDLTIIPLKQKLKPITVTSRRLKNGEIIPFLDDNTVDMGSSFDLFHPVSHKKTNLITSQQAHMRELLNHAMQANGFMGLNEEWWHYTLRNEPYPDTYFNFTT